MAGVDDGVVGIRKQHRANRVQKCIEVAAGQIRAANRPGEQRIANKQLARGVALRADCEADTARAMSRRVSHFDSEIAERQRLPFFVEAIWRRRLLCLQAKHAGLFRGPFVQEQVIAMQPYRNAQRCLCGADAGHVVQVRVCQQDPLHLHLFTRHNRQQLVHIVSRIDDDGLAGAIAGNDVAVFVEGRRGGGPDMHNAIMTRADVEAAARGLRVCRTPLLRSTWLSDRCKADVWIKLEAVQPGGSFKIRGATWALTRLHVERPDVHEVVTASAGNHGVAMSIAAKELGFRLRVHVPVTAPDAKKQTLVGYGATLVEAPDYDAAEEAARQDARETGTIFISPYNHPDVIAGAGTVALEMLEDQPELDAIVVPLGGGGLLAGAALVAKTHTREVKVIGAEAEASPVFSAALSHDAITPVQVSPTLADGLAGNLEPGSMTFPLVRELVDMVALVAEDSIETAMRSLVWRERLVAEGAGATGVGALLQGGLQLEGARIGVMVTGRNVDQRVLRKILA